MAIPGPGTAISMTTIVTEFGGTVPHSLSEYYRGGGLVPNAPQNAAIPTTGAIAMGNFYGATNRTAVALTLATNTYNYDVYTNRGPTYSAGISDVTVTVNPGVVVGSTSTGTYAMLVPSAFSPTDTVTIVNSGVIQGMGGAGGTGGSANPPFISSTAGSVGGNAIYANRPTTITNNGTVAAGGGGGGGGGSGGTTKAAAQGGGGGGGAGFNGGAGAPRSGAVGTSTAGGAGGPTTGSPVAGAGGAGGGRGAAGSAGGTTSTPVTYAAKPGGAAGNYIVGNPFVTWSVTGTRQGGVA